MERLVDAQLTLIHKEPRSISQHHMKLVVGGCSRDCRRPPSPPVPDLDEVKLFKFHQDFWWNRLQEREPYMDHQGSTSLAICQGGQSHLIAVILDPCDNPAIDSPGKLAFVHLHFDFVITVKWSLCHLIRWKQSHPDKPYIQKMPFANSQKSSDRISTGNHTSTSESLLIPKEEIVARDPSAFMSF
ncbi:hypothetical protein L2E82_22703 [Cichorium intybus]|uniref:Uncharacterized protein n=1 Tax=Cichorium intybus TaxID=13427 RepID=A0ACB9DYH3_CICIN|nr:hypothetical protein L2E82_22703 [Cichorium intybus]